MVRNLYVICAAALWLLLGAGWPVQGAQAAQAAQAGDEMLIIAHRGASAERPEHTLAAYERAIDQGADYIELDLVVSRDGVLIARHENEISGTSDIASRQEFESRRRSKTIDGQLVAGWFAEDFDWAELQSLYAKERLPRLRPGSARFNGLYPIPSLKDALRLIRAKEAELGRKIGLYIEIKHPDFLLQEAGVDMVDLLLNELRALGVRADDRVFIQCFEVNALQRLNQRSDFQLVQLMAASGGPVDEPSMQYAAMMSETGLEGVAQYADAIGPDLRLLVETDGTPSALITLAHARGLKVHGWTLRPENAFLPAPLRSAGGDTAHGDMQKWLRIVKRAGADGVFTDAPALAVKANRAK